MPNNKDIKAVVFNIELIIVFNMIILQMLMIMYLIGAIRC